MSPSEQDFSVVIPQFHEAKCCLSPSIDVTVTIGIGRFLQQKSLAKKEEKKSDSRSFDLTDGSSFSISLFYNGGASKGNG